MEPAEAFKAFGLGSILLTWIGLGFLVHRWPGKPHMSLSLHAAQTKWASVYYAALLIPTVTGLYLFMTRWFMPMFHLPGFAYYVLLIGVLGQYLACLVPDTKGWVSKLHQTGAYTMSVTLGIMTGLIVFASRVSAPARLVDLFLLGAMVYLYGLFLFVPKSRERFLFYQSAYVALFHVAILVATYLR